MRTIGLVATALVVTLAIAGVALRIQAQKQEANGQSQIVAQPAQVVILSVPDMFCEGCAAGVTIAAKKVDGVKDMKTDFDKRTAQVTYDPSKTNPEAIANAITKNAGLKVEVPKAAKK